MSGPVPVVLDTNVVLSALVFGGGKAGQLRRAWQQGAFIPLISTATAEELIRVLAYPKFRLSRGEQSELLADYLPYAQTVRISQPPPAVPSCRDALDLPFMELAVVGQAKMLVSGGRDLLVLSAEFERMAGCTIVTMDGFIELLA